MRLGINRLCAVVGLLVISTLVSVAQESAQDSAKETVKVAGKWTVSTQGQRGSRTQNMTIQQDGNKISGTIQGYRGDDPFQGSLEGNDIRFTVTMNTPRGAITLEYRGTVQGDSMKGTIQGPIGSGSWSAKREAE